MGKSTISALALAAMITGLGITAAFADNTDTATVTVEGKVVASLELTVNQNVVMADLVKPDSSEITSLIMSCSAAGIPTLTYDSNGGNPFADGVAAATAVAVGSDNAGGPGHKGTCADISVDGEPNFHYQAVYTLTNGVPTVNGTGITVASPQCASQQFTGNLPSGNTAQLNGSGQDKLFCGATVTVQASASAGAYSGASFTVAVTYD